MKNAKKDKKEKKLFNKIINIIKKRLMNEKNEIVKNYKLKIKNLKKHNKYLLRKG